MGVLSRRPGVRRRTMPVATSIHWKPLRDPHYIVASLQPGGGGRRQIFVRQSTLREVQALAHGDPEQPVVGLLLGERLDCSVTLTPYVLIESHVEVRLASLDEPTLTDAIRTLHQHVGRRNSREVLGWYCSCRSADAAVSRLHAAVHAACFAQRWQTVLTFGDGGKAGAFFLHDATAARWFHAPFYEIADQKASNRAPQPTCVAWPAYLTTAFVAPLAETPQRGPSSPPRTFVAAPVSPAREQAVPNARLIVTVRRTPARDAIAGVGRGVGRAAVAARRSALDLARILGGRAATASRHAAESIVRIRAERAASAAQRKAEAEAARAREEERQAKEAAERRAAREEAQRRAAEAAKRRAAEAETRRAAEVEARRVAAQEAERRRAVEAEARRQAAEAEAQRRAEEVEARRAAEEEAQRQAAEEAQRRAVEAEARRRVAEEARRVAAEEERRRAAEEEQRRVAAAEVRRQAAEAEARRRASEAEAQRLAEAEAEARRQAAEAEAETQRKAAAAEENARRKAAEAEEEARRTAAETDALRISVEVAAIRGRLARAPIEGSKRETPRVAAAHTADVEDSTASDGPYRYLALARREGFEVSEKLERGSTEHPETVWLLHDRESGLRLILVTTDEAVREASLHYNLRTDDDSLLETTAPEHRDLESRTIYGREPCLHDLRARCRRLRATGALERDWKVTPTFQHPAAHR